MPRPVVIPDADIESIHQQLLWGYTKTKICEAHEISLFQLNKIIERHSLINYLKIPDDELKEILKLIITCEKKTWGFTYVNTMFTNSGMKVPKN